MTGRAIWKTILYNKEHHHTGETTMDKFKIRVTDRNGASSDGGYSFSPPEVEAAIYYGDKEVGSMTRAAKGSYWSNGIGHVSCCLEHCSLTEVLGEDNPLIDALGTVSHTAGREKWTMPKAQKELNKVLREHSKAPAQPRSRFSPGQLTTARELKAEGLSYKAIAERIGGSGPGIRNALLRTAK